MSKPIVFTPEQHIAEANKNRVSTLEKLAELNETALTKQQRDLISSAEIFLLGLGVQLKLANEKLGGAT
jgi:hypothetical protein